MQLRIEVEKEGKANVLEKLQNKFKALWISLED